jgi:hypothetical protein
MKIMRIVVPVLMGFLLCSPLGAQDKIDPALSEVWEPEPVVVDPGVTPGPPADAVVLFGEDLSAWRVWEKRPKDSSAGDEAQWEVHDGVLTVAPDTGGIQTRQDFGSIQLHLEWRTPVMEGEGQQKANSGVFLQERYEVQILDSYQNRTYSNGQAASIYKQHIPLVNAARPPAEWQSYDIIFEAPKFDDNGVLASPAFVTVLHNGVLVQNHVELLGGTSFRGAPSYEAHGDAPLALQDHGNRVSFRNIWVRELD